MIDDYCIPCGRVGYIIKQYDKLKNILYAYIETPFIVTLTCLIVQEEQSWLKCETKQKSHDFQQTSYRLQTSISITAPNHKNKFQV